MSDDVRDNGCEAYADDLAELALGALTGRSRAQALSHVESCPRCAEELEQLSRVADVIVQVGPDVEPPVGFEVRLFERMGVVDVRRRRRFRPSAWVPATVAAALLALALGLGLTLSSSPAPTATATAHRHGSVISADLVTNGDVVGHVVAGGGAQPWMSMMLADSTASGHVNCVVVTADGVTHQVGTFWARQGYGAWIAPLHHVKPSTIRRAEVVSPSGTVIATATLG